MAITSNEEARDAILDKFKAAWDANAATHADGVVPPVEWPNILPPDPPLSAGNAPWARVVIKHNAGEQRSFGEPLSRRFARIGVVVVQVFVPAGERGLLTGDRLGKVALDAFEGEESGDVWFKNVVQREIGVDGAWHQTNVIAEFEYDVVK